MRRKRNLLFLAKFLHFKLDERKEHKKQAAVTKGRFYRNNWKVKQMFVKKCKTPNYGITKDSFHRL